MDNIRTGALIRRLRRELGLTQLQLAGRLGVSDKAVSKWERGLGSPEVSTLPRLSQVLGVDLARMLQGDLTPNDLVGGNMKKLNYYACPACGGLTFCTGAAEVSCCGRKLSPLTPRKSGAEERLRVEEVETDWFITSSHPMRKENYISFVAFATGDRLQVVKQYPEWDLQLRIPRRGHRDATVVRPGGRPAVSTAVKGPGTVRCVRPLRCATVPPQVGHPAPLYDIVKADSWRRTTGASSPGTGRPPSPDHDHD